MQLAQNIEHKKPWNYSVRMCRGWKVSNQVVEKNSDRLGINPKKIIAAGGSAGGHVAACTGIINGFETGNLKVSSKPQALVLFNPVCDTSLNGYGNKKIGSKWKLISPLHNINESTPPTCIFHGTSDTTVPLNNVIEFQKNYSKKKLIVNYTPMKMQSMDFLIMEGMVVKLMRIQLTR